MLLGTLGDQQWNVKEVFLTRNAGDDPKTSFIISPEELLEGYQLAEEKQLELVGVFHSHPETAASPSNFDKKFMKVNGSVPWIIFSGMNTDLKAFMLDEDTKLMEKIKIKIIERHFFQ
jgi:proteasome lid subunit RPN8/RPN11